jgi:four helix bundle protein
MMERTKDFALKNVRLYASLPRSVVAQTPGKQMLRCGTSVGAHYRGAVRIQRIRRFRGLS